VINQRDHRAQRDLAGEAGVRRRRRPSPAWLQPGRSATVLPAPQVRGDGSTPVGDLPPGIHVLAGQALAGAERAVVDEDDEAVVPVLHTATASLQLGADGLVRLEPRGTGWRRLAPLVVAAAFEGR